MDPSLLSGDAVWFRPPTRHDGSDIQDLLVTVMQKYVAARGYDLRTDVQVQLAGLDCLLQSFWLYSVRESSLFLFRRNTDL